MDKDNAKSWEKPWTTDEIREHSSNWNLAGDSGLLNHLQQFSQNLLARTHSTEVALDKLVEDLKTTSNSVQNATNTFLFLANTQFVENRVYDDDEKETPPEEKKDDVQRPKTKEEQESEVFQNVKQALDMGLALLDTHFEAVEVPASDSEEDESSASVGRLVLKPKNPYLSRPLPYLIGSREFMEDDKVGLGELYSDTEESPDQNVVQSSESDDEMEHDELIFVSKRPATLPTSDSENSEPESDRSETAVKQKKLKTSISVGASGEDDEGRGMFGQESPLDADEAAVVKGGVKSTFSDELSSKLAAAKSHKMSERENETDNMFVPSSEPEDEAGLFGKASCSFSERQGLFDDLDDWQSTSNPLWKSKSSSSAADSLKEPQSERKVDASHSPDNIVDDMFKSPKQVTSVPANVVNEENMSVSTPQRDTLPRANTDALFGSVDETEDLFHKKSKVTGTAGNKSALFRKDELEDDDLFAVSSSNVSSQPGPSQNPTRKKKLPGAVPVFSNVDLFGNLSPAVQNDSGPKSNSTGRHFVFSGSDVHSSGVGSSSCAVPKSEVVSESQKVENNSSEASSVFGNQSDEFFKNVVSSTKILKNSPSQPALFNSEKDSDSLFDKPRSSDSSALNRGVLVSKTSSTSTSLKPKTKKPVSLFDDSDSGDDELLFSSTSSTSSRSRRSQGSGDVLGSAVEKRTLPRKGFFEDSLLFGSVSKSVPDIDIFSSQSDSKSNVDSSAKDNIFGENEVSGDSSMNSRKLTSTIFDNIDDVDDIFAVPIISVEKTQSDLNKNPQSTLGKLSLFSDFPSDAHDIFSNQISESKRVDGFKPALEETSQPGMSNNSGSLVQNQVTSSNTPSLLSKDSSSQSSVVKNNLENKDVKNTKPAISQKPKVPVKPTPATISLQGSLNISQSHESNIDSNVDNSQNISASEIGSYDVENRNSSRPNNNESHSNRNLEVEKMCDSEATVSSIKPEPPRTLNIRKTTDIVFESPSNEDLFESSWSDKSPLGEDNANFERPKNNVLSSSNFSKLLDDFNSTSACTGSTSNISKELISNGLPASNKTLVSSVTGDNASEVRETQKIIPSPSKLHIDPRTLLPGARPPSKALASDGAVGFDKPAETSILHSAGKERVKIQVKRRPQTRRARQEALRASSTEYDNIDAALICQIGSNKNEVQNSIVTSSASSSSALINTTPKVLEPHNTTQSPVAEKSTNASDRSPKNNSDGQSSVSELDQLLPKNDTHNNILSDCLSGNSNALSPLTDEEDLFAVPHELPFDESSNREMTNEGRNLFGGAPVLSPLDMRTGSDNFGTRSTLKNERERDVFVAAKDDTLHSPLEKTKKSADLFKEGIFGPKVSTSPTALDRDRDSYRNISSISNSDDIFVKHSENKWSDHGDLEKSRENKGLFDDCDNDDGSDDDLFSTVKKPGNFRKKPERPIEDVHQKSLLFSSETNSTLKEKCSEGILAVPIQGKLPLMTGTDMNFLPAASTNVSIDQSASSGGSPVLFSKRISDTPQRKEGDDLFTSNIFTKEVKTGSSFRIKDSLITNATKDKTKSCVESLFGDDSVESDDLFASSSIVPKMSVSGSSSNFIPGSKLKDTKKSLFDDEDDDIFTVGLNRNRGPKSEVLHAREESSQIAEKDTDDLFSKQNSNSRNQGTKPPSAQKVQSFEDPLMVFNK